MIDYIRSSTLDPEVLEALSGFVGLGLASRKNLCVHPEVSGQTSGKLVDVKCHELTASWVRQRAKENSSIEQCKYFEGLETMGGKAFRIPSGVFTLDDLKDYGRENTICPYFLARSAIYQANVIVYSYYYLLDPKVANLVSKELAKESVVIFDEAHNIDNVCIESMSVDITKSTIEAGARSLEKVHERVKG